MYIILGPNKRDEKTPRGKRSEMPGSPGEEAPGQGVPGSTTVQPRVPAVWGLGGVRGRQTGTQGCWPWLRVIYRWSRRGKTIRVFPASVKHLQVPGSASSPGTSGWRNQ